MSAIIRELVNKDEKKVYPVTVADAVYMPDGTSKITEELKDLRGATNTTTFNSDGTITKTMATGKVSTTVFNSDGSITETCKYSDGTTYYVKNTIFNTDGSIATTVDYTEES